MNPIFSLNTSLPNFGKLIDAADDNIDTVNLVLNSLRSLKRKIYAASYFLKKQKSRKLDSTLDEILKQDALASLKNANDPISFTKLIDKQRHFVKAYVKEKCGIADFDEVVAPAFESVISVQEKTNPATIDIMLNFLFTCKKDSRYTVTDYSLNKFEICLPNRITATWFINNFINRGTLTFTDNKGNAECLVKKGFDQK